MPLDMRAQLLVDGTFKDRDTDMDPVKENTLQAPRPLGSLVSAFRRHHRPQNMS